LTNVFYSVILNEKESKKTENVTMPKVKASVKEVAKEIAKNIPWDGMEFFLYEDGEMGVRQIGSFGENESEVIYVCSLEKSYWNDGLTNAGFNIDSSSDWTEKDINDLAEYLEENELSFAVSKHDGEKIEWAEEQIEIDPDFPEELSEEDKKAYLEYLKKYKLESATDNDDFTEEWNEEDRKAYIEFLKETELKFSTDKD
jgi:hypothetical protein